jgi:hypothetical protein
LWNKIDVFFKPQFDNEPWKERESYQSPLKPHKFRTEGFYGKQIRISDPMDAIKAKLDYISKYPNHENSEKHIKDLKRMNIDPIHIDSAIKKSQNNYFNDGSLLRNGKNESRYPG